MNSVALRRFEANVDRTATCWLWTGKEYAKGGYGPYRRAYEHFIGPVPEGLELDHRCCVKACVNPDHLEPVTHAENMRRHYVLTTHCPKGHEYTPVNTYLRNRPDGVRRECRTCHLSRNRGYALKRFAPESVSGCAVLRPPTPEGGATDGS